MNQNYFINVAKTCSVSGHRKLSSDFNREFLKNVLIKVVENGYDTFLIGMALGFDSECFCVLEELRNSYDIKIIACVPCKNQDYKFSNEQKKEYKRQLDSADKVIMLGEEYTPYCMQKRNRFLIDNSSLLICYLRNTYGGTAYTVNYAKKKNINIIKI